MPNLCVNGVNEALRKKCLQNIAMSSLKRACVLLTPKHQQTTMSIIRKLAKEKLKSITNKDEISPNASVQSSNQNCPSTGKYKILSIYLRKSFYFGKIQST